MSVSYFIYISKEGSGVPNDAVEKPQSEHLVQPEVDFSQTKRPSLFLASAFPKIFSLRTLLVWQTHARDTETNRPSPHFFIAHNQLLNIMHHAVQLPLPVYLGFSA